MKTTLRIPTKEQYGYFEVELESEDFTAAAKAYIEQMAAYKREQKKYDDEQPPF